MKQITIGLPLWKSNNRGWLALEGLIRQKDIPCEWELIICEESEECLGLHGLEPYQSKIHDLGGTIKYVQIHSWIPLSMKWYMLSKLANQDSKYFFLQAGDCFSQPYRISDTYQIFEKTGADWVQSPVGYFYHIPIDTMYTFDRYINGKDKPFGMTALNMAVRTKLMRSLPPAEVPYNVDGWMFVNITKKHGKIKVGENITDHWKLGFDSQGLNHISGYRDTMLKTEQPPFRMVLDVKITDIVDQAIVDRMKSSHELLKKRGEYKFLHRMRAA